jgi:exopolyphosphatase/guanosine-5'-triphosphate,3'-diphosphate pyrophosphatase
MATRIALVDMGTNTLKYSVADVQDDGSFREIDVHADTVRLGAGLVASGRIDPERAERAVTSLRAYQARAELLGASIFLGVATAALRRATNGQDVLTAVAERTRWQVKVISGDLEARLTWSGLRHLFPDTASSCWLTWRRVVRSAGHPRCPGGCLGIERHGSGVLADQVFSHYPPGEEVDVAVEQARSLLTKSPVLAQVNEPGLVLSGGNGTFLHALSQWAETKEPFTPDGLRKLMHRIAEQEPAAIAKHLGIAPERAQMIPAGAAIAVAIADIVGPTSLWAVPSGVRAGMVHEWLAGTW